MLSLILEIPCVLSKPSVGLRHECIFYARLLSKRGENYIGKSINGILVNR